MYVLLRKLNREIYVMYYKLMRWNHETKVFRRLIFFLLFYFNIAFLLINILFGIVYTFFPESGAWWSGIIFIGASFKLFLQWPIGYTLVDLFSLFVIHQLKKITEVYDNEDRMAQGLHRLVHKYRDFIDHIITEKRGTTAFSKSPFPKKQGKYYKDKYNVKIQEVCQLVCNVLKEVINDKKAFVTLSLLEQIDKSKSKFVHIYAYPDPYPNQYIDNIEIRLDGTVVARNLYQFVYNNYYNLPKENGKSKDGWGLGQNWGLAFISNDIKGHKCYNPSLTPGEIQSAVKSAIIVPINLEDQLVGFLTFNSSRSGMLREKHKHFLAGHCDLLANLLRNTRI